MQIRSKLHREGGSHIELDGKTYHFAPNEKGDHVADVADEAHIATLLSISEGFEEYGEPIPEEGAIGIATMRKKELLDLAGQNGIEVNPSAPVVALRKQLAAALPDYGKVSEQGEQDNPGAPDETKIPAE